MKTKAFEKNTERYEQWFVKHKAAYLSEIDAVRALMPTVGETLEIGVGTGRFAIPLEIKNGVEPCAKMASLAKKAGIKVIEGVAENLPFKEKSFDAALMVTTICFVDNPKQSVKEAWRVLKKNASMIMAFVDVESPLGQTYLAHQQESVFYQDAVFFSANEIISLMKEAGFRDLSFKQTLFHPLDEVTNKEPVKDGYGEGSFVVIRGIK